MERRHGAASWSGVFQAPTGTGVLPGAWTTVLRPRIREKPGGRIVSPPPLLVLTPQREKERRAQSPFEEENQDVQPPSFEFTHLSKEGAKDDAPPNERGDFPVADRGCKGGQESPPSKSPSCLKPSGTEMHTTGRAGTAEN